ncbi:unnamed protein product [Effrenium voratum]|nr:unnamed protein product [Effrenium voratum]
MSRPSVDFSTQPGMGNQASQAPKAFSALRRAGEPLNTLGYQATSEPLAMRNGSRAVN